MVKKERTTARTIALFVAGMFAMGAFALAPATAHVGTSTKHLQKHLDKRYERTDNVVQLGFKKAAAGQAVTLGKVGAFTFVGECYQDGGVGGSLEAEIQIQTAVDNASMESDDDDEEDFDISDNGNPVQIANASGGAPGSGPTNSSDNDIMGFASTSSGKAISWSVSAFTSFAGADCAFSGVVFKHS